VGHDSSHVLKEFVEISRDTGNVPAESERYLFVRGAPEFEAYSCCHSVRMRDETADVNTEIVGWVWVSPDTHGAKHWGNMVIPEPGGNEKE
jgi:hypothetical protein